MTRTCSQCSAYHGKLWCDRFKQKTLPGAPICSNPRNGWDIEWKASGIDWHPVYSVVAGSCRVDEWLLFKRGYGFAARISRMDDEWTGETVESIEVPKGALEHCAKALIARVKGENCG